MSYDGVCDKMKGNVITAACTVQITQCAFEKLDLSRSGLLNMNIMLILHLVSFIESLN